MLTKNEGTRRGHTAEGRERGRDNIIEEDNRVLDKVVKALAKSVAYLRRHFWIQAHGECCILSSDT